MAQRLQGFLLAGSRAFRKRADCRNASLTVVAILPTNKQFDFSENEARKRVSTFLGSTCMLTYGNSVSFQDGHQSPVTMRNFSEPEDGFVWSIGKWCELGFDFQDAGKQIDGRADLLLDVEAFHVPEQLPEQTVLVYLNGIRVASAFVSTRTHLIGCFDRRWLRPSDNLLTVDTPDVVLPTVFGVADTRPLGIKLYSIQIRKAD